MLSRSQPPFSGAKPVEGQLGQKGISFGPGQRSIDFEISRKRTQSWIFMLLLFALSANLFYPGEIFFQSKYLLISVALLAALLACICELRSPTNDDIAKNLLISFLPFLAILPSFFSTINAHRSLELFVVVFRLCLSLFLSERGHSVTSTDIAGHLLLVSRCIRGQFILRLSILYWLVQTQKFIGSYRVNGSRFQVCAIDSCFIRASLRKLCPSQFPGGICLYDATSAIVSRILSLLIIQPNLCFRMAEFRSPLEENFSKSIHSFRPHTSSCIRPSGFDPDPIIRRVALSPCLSYLPKSVTGSKNRKYPFAQCFSR